MHNGTIARIAVPIVIRIGRRRSRLPCDQRIGAGHAVAAQVVDVLDHDDAVVHHHAHQHQDADEGHDDERGAGQPNSQNTPKIENSTLLMIAIGNSSDSNTAAITT